MSVRKQKRRLKQWSDHLLNGDELSAEARNWLAVAFVKIAGGEDANKALGLNYSAGHSNYDDLKRQQLSVALHWVAGAIQPEDGDGDGDGTGLGLSITAACKKASELYGRNFKYKGRKIILDPEYLRQCWYNKRYKHMRNHSRHIDDPDFPYDH